ncbi:PEP-CTERM sorting domain-containing protein [Tundrisphaera sp. TA3]|uniref:PEP-CTERM sorting domain-containing protein n=1 Tax=Tundrisphaera sp. TA3 TaxID=3435775 RepID=UPI003EC128A7
MNLRRARTILPLVASLLIASAAHASPIWIRVRIEDGAQGRIIDLPADGHFASTYVTGQGEVVGSGISLPRVEAGPVTSPPEPGRPFTSAVDVTFKIPTPAEIADPANWSWQRDNRPADVILSGTASGVYGWGGDPFSTHVSLDGMLQEGRIASYPGSVADPIRELPPELIDLAAHPERVQVSASATGRRTDQLVMVNVQIQPAIPTPEPTGMAMFGLLMGGLWLVHRRSR